MSGQSDFLFAQPSFWEGAGRILDFGDFLTEYNRSLSPEQADMIATTMDWQAVYNDLWEAFQNYHQAFERELQDERATAGVGD